MPHNEPQATEPIRRGNTYKYEVGDRSVHVTVNRDMQDRIVEVFVNVGKPTYSEMVAADIVGRLISVALKLGAPVDEVVQHLSGHSDGTCALARGLGYHDTVWAAVARTLSGETDTALESRPTQPSPCPNCNVGVVVQESGHWSCHTCGWTPGT